MIVQCSPCGAAPRSLLQVPEEVGEETGKAPGARAQVSRGATRGDCHFLWFITQLTH